MRRLAKTACPQILAENKVRWTEEFIADPANGTKRYKYRHADIKSALVEETSDKCIYCESKIGHNTPGDVEHKIPSSLDPQQHFEWSNLSIACTECNRRKNDYFDALKPFLDPYNDDVENQVSHYGPVVSWQAANASAEISVRTLELDSWERKELLFRKIEKIDEINNLRARADAEQNPALKQILLVELLKCARRDQEYSAMVMSILKKEKIIA